METERNADRRSSVVSRSQLSCTTFRGASTQGVGCRLSSSLSLLTIKKQLFLPPSGGWVVSSNSDALFDLFPLFAWSLLN